MHREMGSHSISRQPIITPTRSIDEKDDTLIRLNRQLDSVCAPFLINEAFIAEFHCQLLRYDRPEDVYYWLLYARITEAALLCAGNFADNCEYSAAGDLLVNPRRIDVYNRECAEPARKYRHGSLSEQFKPEDMSDEQFRNRYASNLKLQIAEPALLPLMAKTLERSGIFCENYLASIKNRMNRIADTMAFLSAWPVANRIELHERLESLPPESKRFIQRNLCRFNPAAFEDLGAELRSLERSLPAASIFI